MSRAALMYLVGFACVWGAVGLWCTALAAFRSFSRDWDRAFQRELMGDRSWSPRAVTPMDPPLEAIDASSEIPEPGLKREP
jgi:hypothetical protein